MYRENNSFLDQLQTNDVVYVEFLNLLPSEMYNAFERSLDGHFDKKLALFITALDIFMTEVNLDLFGEYASDLRQQLHQSKPIGNDIRAPHHTKTKQAEGMYQHKFPNGEILCTKRPITAISLPLIQSHEMKLLLERMTSQEIDLFLSLRVHQRRYYFQEMKQKYSIGQASRAVDNEGNEIPYDHTKWTSA